MSDALRHRGSDPRDAEAFGPPALLVLREAVADLSWLLGRGYPPGSALKLVGDRGALTARQRMAVGRSACAASACARRLCHEVDPDELAAEPLFVDGFNVLTTIEAALGGAVILGGSDGCFRDLAGIHGTYRKVETTRPALALIGQTLRAFRVGPVTWLLDSPVSNSGRLRAVILEVAQDRGWDWRVELVFNPDPILEVAREIVATADSVILDRCDRWFNLARSVVETAVAGAWVLDLR